MNDCGHVVVSVIGKTQLGIVNGDGTKIRILNNYTEEPQYIPITNDIAIEKVRTQIINLLCTTHKFSLLCT